MKVDKRATNSIKICINKLFKNKDSLNLDIAKCISSFSHATVIKYGSVFKTRSANFYIVNKVSSPFWVEIVWLPPVSFHSAGWGHFIMIPQWAKASCFHKKRVFDPFGTPYLKKRGTKYFFKKGL